MTYSFSEKSIKTGSPILELPGGKLYSGPCKIQPLTFSDVESIKLSQESQSPIPLYDVLNKRMSLDIRDMHFPDVKFILLWHRLNSYGVKSFPVNWKCPHCGTLNTFDFNDIEDFENVSDDYNKDGVKIKLSSGDYSIRLSKVGDELDAIDYASKDSNLEDTYISVVRKAMMFEPNGGTLKQRINILENDLNADDNLLIDEFEKEFDYGVSSITKATCKECGKESNVNHELTLGQFLSRPQNSGSIRNKILHSVLPKADDSTSGGDSSSNSDGASKSLQEGDGGARKEDEEKPKEN